jgi:hypothetical protein
MTPLRLLLALVFVALSAQSQIATQEWSRLVDASPGYAYGYTLAADPAGNVITVGSIDRGTNWFGVAVKYSSVGVPIWTNLYGPREYVEFFVVTTDTNGNVYASGSVTENISNTLVTVKYASNGTPLWTNTLPRAGGYPWSIAVNNSGTLFIAMDGADGLAAISSTGSLLWTNAGFYPGGWRDMAIDKAGKVYCTGYFVHTNETRFNTVAYNTNGTPAWTNETTGGFGNYYASPAAITLDTNHGRVIVTGAAQSDSTNAPSFRDSVLTIAYTTDGVPLWTNIFSDFFGSVGSHATTDSDGNVYVTGWGGTNGSYPYAPFFITLKYSPTGVRLWTNTYHTELGAINQAQAIALDGNDHVIITGLYQTATDFGKTTIAYTTSGLPLWTNSFQYMDGFRFARCLAVDKSGDAYTAGWVYDDIDDAYRIGTVKYSWPAPGEKLFIESQPPNVVLRWTNAAWSLQSAPLVTGTFTNIPGAANPYTNAPSATQRYFRLIKN